MDDFLDWVGDLIGRGDIVSWLIVLGLTLLAGILLKGALRLICRRLSRYARSGTGLDDLLIDLVVSTKTWFFFFIIFYLFGIPALHPGEGELRGFKFLFVVAASIQVALWGIHSIRHWRKVHFERRAGTDATSLAAIGLLATAIQGVFIIIIVLLGLSNLGVDIAALLAGLGVGGIAVALAAQNVLGDLFASVSIVVVPVVFLRNGAK